MTLSDLRPRQSAVVEGFSSHGAPLLRLQEQGVVTGSEVEFIRKAPLGDPLEIRLENSHLTLRRSEAAQIRVRVITS